MFIAKYPENRKSKDKEVTVALVSIFSFFNCFQNRSIDNLLKIYVKRKLFQIFLKNYIQRFFKDLSVFLNRSFIGNWC